MIPSGLRRRVVFVLDLAVNFLLPWLMYRASRPHVDETHAIMISASAPMVWGLVQFARSRKVDTFSVISLAGITVSLAIFAFGGSPKILLVRESFFGGAIGVLFLASALIGRPLMFELMRGILKSMPAGESGKVARAREELEAGVGRPWFRRIMTKMTVVFGFFMIAEMAARIALAFALPTERFLLVAPIVRWVIAGLVMAWIFFFIRPAFARGPSTALRQAQGDTEALVQEADQQ